MLTYEHVILDFSSSTGSFCFYQISVIHASVLNESDMDNRFRGGFCLIVTILKILDTKNMSSVTNKMLNLVNCDVTKY